MKISTLRGSNHYGALDSMLEKLMLFWRHLWGFSFKKKYLLLKAGPHSSIYVYTFEKNGRSLSVIVAKERETSSSVALYRYNFNNFLDALEEIMKKITDESPSNPIGSASSNIKFNIMYDKKCFMRININNFDRENARIIFGYGAECQIFIDMKTASLASQIKDFMHQIGERKLNV